MIPDLRSRISLAPFRWRRMALKELREILRDRRTIITLIGMPILIYPLLGVTFQKMLVSQVASSAKTTYRIAFASNRDHEILEQLIEQADRLNGRSGSLATHTPAGTPDDPVWEVIESDNDKTSINIESLVSEVDADVGVQFHSQRDDGPWDVELVYRSASRFSLDACRCIEDRLRSVNDLVIARMIRDLDLPLKIPLSFKKKGVASPNVGASFSMSTLIPLILILMTVTGAVYPAIDLTAGERERGTLEALVSAPVPRHELLFAKFVAVLAVAMLTAIANLGSMVITAWSSGMEQLLFGSGGVNLRMLALMLGLLVLFAGFFASVILVLTSFARSFKEAQAYLIPVMLVSLAPGVICLMPGIEMTGWLSVTPLVNIVILSRDVFDGHAQSAWVLTTLLSTMLYSFLALSIAARIFGTDAVLYGSEGSWVDLFQRPTRPRATATLTQAIGCLAFLMPAFLILSGVPARLTGESPIGHVIGNAVMTVILFAVVPLAVTQWNKVDWGTGLNLRPTHAIYFVSAACLGLSLWPFALELARWQFSDVEQNERVKEMFRNVISRFDQIPLVVKLITLALIPAVCEELFFRGYLLTTLRTGMSNRLAIVLSSVVFGLFHVIATMSFERFLPTCFLGLILGWVASQSGSALPGMALHTIHNSLILLMQTFIKHLHWLGAGAESELRVPTIWLAGATIGVAVGIGLLAFGVHPRQTATPMESNA